MENVTSFTGQCHYLIVILVVFHANATGAVWLQHHVRDLFLQCLKVGPTCLSSITLPLFSTSVSSMLLCVEGICLEGDACNDERQPEIHEDPDKDRTVRDK